MDNAYVRLLIYLYTSEKSSADYEIAKVLLKQYEYFPDILIEDVANKAHATAATVTKFAHKLGYRSFKELRNDCIQQEQHDHIQSQLQLASESYEQACEAYTKEEQEKISFYMRYHEEAQVKAVASLLTSVTELGVCYTHYAYPCVHVLRNYMTPFQKNVQGVMRELDDETIEARMSSCQMVVVISLQGSWIKEHNTLLETWKEKGKHLIIVTGVYEESFMKYTNHIIPFQFLGDTILDSAHQISSFFVKVAFAYANFPKVEKSERKQ